MAKDAGGAPPDKLALYEKLVATLPGVERKGATVPYTSLNGHMFSYLGKTGTLALRLPVGVRDEFLVRYRTRLCEQYGVVQKEYVEVPDALLGDTATLKRYFAASFSYVGSLKPKPTTRSAKKPAAKKPAAGKAATGKAATAKRPAARKPARR